jgi:CBS domain-containing protein
VYEFLDYLVEDVMSRDVVQVPLDASLAEVERVFEEHDFNGLPVVDADGRIVGWLTKYDVLKAFRFTDDHMFPPYEEIMKQQVAGVMNDDPITMTPRTHLTKVLEGLVSSRGKSFPVVEDHRVVGIVSREDVLGALRRAAAGERAVPPDPPDDTATDVR